MKKWKCTVCGYIHEGEEPPETCPVCGADRSKFVEIPSEEAAPAEPYPPSPPQPTGQAPLSRTYDFVTGQMYKHHIHPISVHVPNGVAPAAVIFLMLSLFFRLDNLALVAFYNMVFVAAAMPLVLFSGYIDWQKRFGGNLTSLFTIKIICGVVVLLTSVVLVGWRLYDPNVAAATSSSRWMFLFIHLILLGAAGTAGFCGGKLVFNQD